MYSGHPQGLKNYMSNRQEYCLTNSVLPRLTLVDSCCGVCETFTAEDDTVPIALYLHLLQHQSPQSP